MTMNGDPGPEDDELESEPEPLADTQTIDLPDVGPADSGTQIEVDRTADESGTVVTNATASNDSDEALDLLGGENPATEITEPDEFPPAD